MIALAPWASASPLSKVLLALVIALPLLYAPDAYRSFEVRRDVADGMQKALVIRDQVEQQILAGKPAPIAQPKQFAASFDIALDPVHSALTLRYLSLDIDGGGKTLVWVPIALAEGGSSSLVEAGRVPKKISWVCLSSLSTLKSEYPWANYRGTLNSKYAPAACRY